MNADQAPGRTKSMQQSELADYESSGEWPAEYHQRIAECSDPEQPYHDKELLEYLYTDEEMSQLGISRLFDCSSATVRNWLVEFDISIRSRAKSMQMAHGNPKAVALKTNPRGHTKWTHRKQTVLVHRLQAVAEWGFDAVVDKIVHHKNEVPWDNRIDNFKLMEWGAHTGHHARKFDEEKRVQIAEEYRDEEISQSDLGDRHGASRLTIGRVIREVEEKYGMDCGRYAGQRGKQSKETEAPFESTEAKLDEMREDFEEMR